MASCSNCGHSVVGNFCAQCGARTDDDAAPPPVADPGLAARAVAMVDSRHGVPALLSFFLPGVGQLVKGDLLSAVFVWVITIFLGALCAAGIGFFLLPLFWIWNVYDAYVAPDGPTKRELKRLGKR